jgi:hypothetical protein
LCGKEDKKKKKKKLMTMEEEEDCLWSYTAIVAAFGHPRVCMQALIVFVITYTRTN